MAFLWVFAINSYHARSSTGTGWSSARPSHSDSPEAYQPRTRKGSKVKKKEAKNKNECTRVEWKKRGKGNIGEEAVGSTPRYCTRLYGCVHNRGPRKRSKNTTTPGSFTPETNFLLFVTRPDRIYAPDTIYVRFLDAPVTLSPYPDAITLHHGRKIHLFQSTIYSTVNVRCITGRRLTREQRPRYNEQT